MAAPGASWWAEPVDLDALRYASRFNQGDKEHPPTQPTLGDTSRRLARWRTTEIETNEQDRTTRPDDPTAAYSGHWWSTPGLGGLVSTSRSLSQLGAIKLIWEEDSPGEIEAQVWPMVTTRSPHVYEVNSPNDWIDLVRRYPLDVSASRRHDWYRVTGRDGTWLIPDFAAISADWDAVHLSVAGYLTTATRLLMITDRAGTVLAGWDPDQTWWLTDCLEVAGPAEYWHSPSSPARSYQWRIEPRDWTD